MKNRLASDPAIKNIYDKDHKLEPLLKWPGGKESELKHILPALPASFENYYEPFVGGGSVYKAINAKHYFINDKSHELISFYRLISSQDNDFFAYLDRINSSWIGISELVNTNWDFLVKLYIGYRNDDTSLETIRSIVDGFLEANQDRLKVLFSLPEHEGRFNIAKLSEAVAEKVVRIRTIEERKHELSENDVFENLEAAIKAAYYIYLRELYNEGKDADVDHPLMISLFYFLRNYAYSGMFRYGSKGNFNVPYGGIGYNRKFLSKKIDYFRSQKLLDHFARTTFESYDFQDFFEKHQPTEKDFIFLDPPYDSEFSTYANNSFGKAEQERLADYLINGCHGKWMMVINNTEFIHSLYNVKKLSIESFDKKYLVSFMNRNEKKAQHLLIRNY